MEDDNSSEYNDGDIVWVKLSYCWWPGEVLSGERLTDDFVSTLKRRPLAVVKFFDEDSYEYVKNTNFIYKYNCNRKNEFLKKGLEQYRSKNKHMEKFPSDVMHAERATGGDPNIVNSSDFLPQKRESYSNIFQPDSNSKAKGKASTPRFSKKSLSPSKVIPVIPVRKHEVRILAQSSTATGVNMDNRGLLTPSNQQSPLSATSRLIHSSLNSSLEHRTPDNGVPLLHNSISPSQIYHCHKCGFESGRQNVIVLHTKYCRAVPIVPLNVSSLRASKPTTSTPNIATEASKAMDANDAELPAIKIEHVDDVEASVQQEEMVEVIQVLESSTVQGRSSRASRTAAMSATPTPKLDRRKNRSRGKTAVNEVPIIDSNDNVDAVVMKVENTEEPIAEGAGDVDGKKTSSTSEHKDEKDIKNKPDVELKNELLADWSEDEQDDQDEEAQNQDKSATKTSTPTGDVEKDAISAEKTAHASNDGTIEKSAELSPQITSPVSSSATTIKYRNIPKKQKREFIEVTNDQPSQPVSAIEKSSSDSSISTAATCGETLSGPDKTPTSGDASSERPISAKQRILDRATRASSKSISSDDLKQEISSKAATLDNQQTSEEELKKETSCFDFKEEEEEEVILNKSPRRSLSNRRDTSLELNTSVPDIVVKDQDDQQERAKKDANLRNEIESLLSETSVPNLPELPKTSRTVSPVPSSSSTETTPQSKEDIDRNRTLPPKERGKRIFKTRNKVIENEAIALEQSKAIVMDFVKKSHEEELAELREQQEAEAKQCSESPTTTNDDSQESLTLNEPVRFENSEFAAIKAKRTKLPQTNDSKVATESKEKPQESFVSSSNETKTADTESIPVSISKEQLALDALEKTPVPSQITKGKKGKYRKSNAPISVVSKSFEDVEVEQPPRVEEPTQKRRKKRSSELENLDLTALDTPRSRRGRSVKQEEPATPEMVESMQSNLSDKQRKMKRSKKEELSEEVPQVEIRIHEKLPSETMSPVDKKGEPDAVRPKRYKHLQQHSADSTADLQAEPEPFVLINEGADKKTSVPDAESAKQHPLKMIIKSKGRKTNAEIVFDQVITSPESENAEELKECSPISLKSSKRKKGTGGILLDNSEKQPGPETSFPSTQDNSGKSLKPKRPKFKQLCDKELTKFSENLQLDSPSLERSEPAGPSVTDLQIAEALINLPEAAPTKAVVREHEPVDKKSNNSPLPVTATISGSTVKTINPRKRHLQTLLSSPEVLEQPKQTGSKIIPEKKKRETIEVVSVAPATIVLDKSTVANSINTLDDDKFDINNIPIVMDDSELLEDSTISTTTVAGIVPNSSDVNVEEDNDEEKLPLKTKSAPKATIVVLKNSNDSSNPEEQKEPAREISSPVPRRTPGVKSTTITIKTPCDQLSPRQTQSPAHSPPIRSAQLVQAGSGGQIVITSKGTVLTTQSSATSSKTNLTVASKAQVVTTQSSTKKSTVTSASSLSAISSSTTKPLPSSATTNQQRTNNSGGNSNSRAASIKSSAKISVQSQEIINHPGKARSTTKESESTSLKKTEMSKKYASSSSPPKKVIMKKLSDSVLSSGKPLFSTSKGAPITPQPATSSALNHGKKAHRVIKISPQKLKEFTRLGMVEDKGQGKVLTASGMRKFRQEQQLLQQQQKSKSGESKKVSRADSVDEEPSTSTPTPPPPSDTPSEVVIAAAADSSVKEIPVISSDVEEPIDVAPSTSTVQSPEKSASPDINTDESLPVEENEADATIGETEVESSTANAAEESEPPGEAVETVESVHTIAETSAETAEPGSNVQESSQLIAVPAENFGGPANLFYLCSVREEGFVPVNNELLYLDSSNQLVALPEHSSVEDLVNQAEVLEISTGSDQATVVTATASGDIEGVGEAGQQNILLNTQDGQQIILDQQSLMALAAGGDTSHLLTPDGQQILLQGSAQELLAALAVSQASLGIVAAEGTQIIVASESLIDLQDAPLPGEIIQVNPNTTVETNAVLTKPPIMSTVEVPTKNGNGAEASIHSPEQKTLETVSTNLDESLAAVIGVPGNPNVPTSLELPITVTNPVIAKTTTSKINPIYPPTTAISTIGIDPAAAIIDLPTVAQTDSLTSIKSIWE
ncbi:mucin-5AC isoform X2 [Toxorhynchites rutilus septentrionalis]|uniref:mucin-5AC isoform X2 n=1 Tax=Toxorhynchites rutilus septentrionalis TaxID=329112 RepID=UPI002479B155|nr:mucin-5AC isoform X2 [Toxorhynchites rutilus septentrionalis]